MEPEIFYSRVAELFYKLRRIPVKEQEQESFNNRMDACERLFYGYAKRVEFHHKMRQTSSDKRYQKPSLGPRFKKDAYEMIKIFIHFSLLPK